MNHTSILLILLHAMDLREVHWRHESIYSKSGCLLSLGCRERRGFIVLERFADVGRVLGLIEEGNVLPFTSFNLGGKSMLSRWPGQIKKKPSSSSSSFS